MEQMTPRERMLTAMRNGTPDLVPVATDMSNMIPSRLTGKPFWSIYAEITRLWATPASRPAGLSAWMAGIRRAGSMIPSRSR